MVEENKNCFVETLKVIWQLPIFSCIFLLGAYISCIAVYNLWGDVEEPMNNLFENDDSKKWLMLGLVAVFSIDSMICVMSFLTSEWVYNCCCNKVMDKCSCFSQMACWGLNWLLFGMSYVMAIGFVVTVMAMIIVIIFAATADGICALNSTDILDEINNMLESLSTFVCSQADRVENGEEINCSSIPHQLPDSMTPEEFCADVHKVTDAGTAIFVYCVLLLICQFTFAIIQRANLVEGAARRGFAKQTNKEKNNEAEMASGADIQAAV